MNIVEKILENTFRETGFDITNHVQIAFVKEAMKSSAWEAWKRGLNEENIEKEREFFEIWYDMDLNEQEFCYNESDKISPDYKLAFCPNCFQIKNHINGYCGKCNYQTF